MTIHLILGPSEHGVTRHGAALAGPHRVELAGVGPDARDLAEVLATTAGPVHVHLTDHLLGADPATIDRALGVLAATPGLHVTLHDIPQEAEGAQRFARRRELYRRLVAVAASVQVCSHAERRMLEDLTGEHGFGVTPLPVDVPAEIAEQSDPAEVNGAADQASRPMFTPSVGVLGFIHPGKNPALAVDVALALGLATVHLVGSVVNGHEEFLDAVVLDARRRGVVVHVTGFLGEEEMTHAVRSVAVPLAPYRHISASGSIGRWIQSGRRPIALTTPWVRELADRAPWAIEVVDEDHLVAAARAALDDPASTLTHGRRDGLLSTSEAARLQAIQLAEVTRD